MGEQTALPLYHYYRIPVMSAQPKLLRMLRLIQLLHQKPYKNIRQLADSLEVNQRTVYRYLTTLEDLGYLIDKTFAEQFFLFTKTDDDQPDHNLTVQEFEVLDQMLTLFNANQPLFESCRRKLEQRAVRQQLAAGLPE